jgi:hypothetical protein
MGLERRGMELDTKCVMCNRLFESGCHLFFGCKHVKSVWQEIQKEQIRTLLVDKQSAREVIRCILNMEEKVQILVITLLYNWWMERNRVREREKRRNASTLAALISNQATEFLLIGRKEVAHAPRQQQHWRRPNCDVLKINSDGAFVAASGEGGWGFVTRNDQGDVVKAGAGRKEFLMDALHSEMVACLMGVQTAVEMGITKVQIEIDSMLLKLALDSNTFELAATGGIVFEI